MQPETKTRRFLVTATSSKPGRPTRYFQRYATKTVGSEFPLPSEGSTVLWTEKRSEARRFPKDEAMSEARLLAPTYPTRLVGIVEWA